MQRLLYSSSFSHTTASSFQIELTALFQPNPAMRFRSNQHPLILRSTWLYLGFIWVVSTDPSAQPEYRVKCGDRSNEILLLSDSSSKVEKSMGLSESSSSLVLVDSAGNQLLSCLCLLKYDRLCFLALWASAFSLFSVKAKGL